MPSSGNITHIDANYLNNLKNQLTTILDEVDNQLKGSAGPSPSVALWIPPVDSSLTVIAGADTFNATKALTTAMAGMGGSVHDQLVWLQKVLRQMIEVPAQVPDRQAGPRPLPCRGERGTCLVLEHVAVRLADQLHDLHQLSRIVVLELHRPREPRREPRIGVDEPAHLVRVARDDHDHVVAAVLHQLHQGVDRLPAEVRPAAGISGGPGVGLVDEQHAPACFPELLCPLPPRRPDEPGH